MYYTAEEKTEIANRLEKLPIERIAERFGNEYQFIYDAYDRVAGYREAVDAGDEILQAAQLKQAVGRLGNYRQDFISSDRECAALAWTFAAVLDEAPDPITGELLIVNE